MVGASLLRVDEPWLRNRRGPKLRCAVYTRKSTEDGLDQEYNSLDAQFDACSAYVLSQRHEGWTLRPDRYDDGGFSGGNMERPGLKRLLADVAAGKVDIIVLYKIDRLTRSLADFAKIVEILDAANASFVSVTQALNTTTSMGRLMLNVLLSFAQFEREMTGERIRDKIAASKKKGLWMGGPVPLGYIVQSRKLVVEENEAETVRHIMRRYLALSSVNELVAELERDGYRTKVQRQASGPHRGGCVFRRGTLYHLPPATAFISGEIVHKGAAYPGEHEPIVPMELWHEVQDKMASQASGGARRSRVRNPSLLIGLILDGLGRAMTPTHAKKGSRNYRYYVTRPEHIDDEPAWRVSAHDVEGLVCAQLADLLRDEAKLIALTNAQALGADQTQKVLWAAERATSTLRAGFPPEKAELLRTMIERVSLHDQQISVELKSAGLFQLLGLDPAEIAPIIISTAAARVRRGHQIRLIIPGLAIAKTVGRNRDPKLVALIGDAVTARDLVLSSSGKSLQQIASENGRCRKRLAKLLTVSFLAPDIVTAIVEGRQPSTLTPSALLTGDLPMAWHEQRSLLGVA